MQKDKTISITRRRFAQLLGVGAAYAAANPGLSLATPRISANFAAVLRGVPANGVRLNSNENPYGPSRMALQAMSDAFKLAWRYPDEHADLLVDMLAKINGVDREQILLGDGSGEILKLCAAAFTGPVEDGRRQTIQLATPTRGGALRSFSPGRGKLIVADPTFEAMVNHATVGGAQVVKVPLTKTFSHDVARMSAAAQQGLIYICNPNNPTASITPKNELRELILRTPPETMILVDEAYYHYADSPDYESVIPLIKDHANLIVARTFSKIYGMAGLRCGYCIAQKQTIQRLRPHQTWDSVNIMAIVAAIASLNDSDQVANGRKLNSETRAYLSSELKATGYGHIPSQANFVMIDMRRPISPLLAGLKQRGVQVGRLFPSLPNHMRVTVGKRSEMETFLTAFREVIA